MPRVLIRLSLFAAVLICAASPALAQQIQGDVRYAANNQPAARVTVACDGTGGNSIQMTDASGKFYFRVSPGQYTCYVRIPGYKPAELSATLTDTYSNEYFPFKLISDGTAAPGTASTIDASVPEGARKEFEKGEAALAGGKKDQLLEASLHYEKALTIYPKFLQAQLKLGTTYMDLQQWDKAEAALRHAIELDPKAANAYLALGELYWQQKKGPEAEKALLEGVAIEDRSWQGHLTLARIYVDMAAKIKDDTQNRPLRVKAFEQVNEALKYNPDLAPAHFIKGNLLVSVGRDLDAQHEFEEYVRLAPKGPFADKAKTLIERIKKAVAEKKP
ncbi:MAG: repeat protein [Acidobacteria bacterium]|nr:repeat protein [Acidobacteriota bacterium]